MLQLYDLAESPSDFIARFQRSSEMNWTTPRLLSL